MRQQSVISSEEEASQASANAGPLSSGTDAAPVSAATSAGVIAEGAHFGDYVVGPCIGHGEVTRIYRAEHQGLSGQIALKIFTDEFSRDPESCARFSREARIAAAIRHPSVVNVFDVGEKAGVPFLVMELLEGEDLDARLKAHGALSETALADIIVPIVAGLAAVHDAGIVHGDLKPSSVFLQDVAGYPEPPKLLDFGIATASGGERLRRASGTRGLWRGSPLYLSPESVRGDAVTALSDQYSLGVVIYQAATGSNPFSADSFAEAVRRITSGEYPPLSQQPGLSPALVRTVERAMSLEPSQRFADVRDLGRALIDLASDQTRMTWGLSFADSAPATVRQPFPPELVRELAEQPPWPKKFELEWSTAAAIAVGVLSFAAAAVILWS